MERNNYFTEDLSLTELAKRNMNEARRAKLSDTRGSINNNGIHAGLVFWNLLKNKTTSIRNTSST